ncbi:MAG: glycosyltransferase family 87 protein [Chloroflexi bacterium]|nr:glycosyltransferase family 87 protein [Chloroflexota bacterium]
MDYLTRLAARYLNPKRRKYAWLAGIMLWAGWLLSIGLGPGKLDLAGQVVGTDYLEFYAAGTTVRIGESVRLYDVAYQTQLQQTIIGPQLHHYYGFITPPFLAWLFAPLSALPYLWSFALWSALGLAALWLSLRLLAVPDPRRAGLWALTFFPVFAAVSFGQNSLLSLLLLSLVYRLWRRGEGWAAGLTASLLLYKPQLLLGVTLLWLLEGLWPAPDGNVMLSGSTSHSPLQTDSSEASPSRGRDSSLVSRRGALFAVNPLRVTVAAISLPNLAALLGLSVGSGLLIALCFWQLPAASRAYVIFARAVLPDLPAYQDFPLWNLHTVWGFWRLLLPHHEAWADALYGVSAVLGMTGFVFFWRRHRVRSDLTFAAATCITLWITPHAMIYDWTLLLIPAVLLWQAAPEQRDRWTALYAPLWLVSFVSGPLTRGQLAVLPIAVQISVPGLLAALWLAGRWLNATSAHSAAQ